MEHLEQRGFQHLEIWGRGVDLRNFYPRNNRSDVCLAYGIDESKFIILFVGRLAPEKSVDIAISAFENLPERVRNNSSLVIAGDGPLYHDLSQQYHGREDIHFTGFAHGEQLASLYSAADVFLFPSATETFGNVVLEAMGSGTPVIGAESGGVKDNIKHGTTGILCPPGNIEAFAQAVTLLYDNPDLRQHLIASARKYSEEQSWELIFTNLLKSYENVVKQTLSYEMQGNIAHIQ
jgi:glycosyltransferase involved in cell wall biosynthesis